MAPFLKGTDNVLRKGPGEVLSPCRVANSLQDFPTGYNKRRRRRFSG
jgi:hypothetical protein